MRHLVNKHEMRVDPGTAILQFRSDLKRFIHVACPHRTCQTEIRIVRPAYRLLGTVETGDGYNRSEDFSSHDFIVLQRACNDGGFIEESARIGRFAAGCYLDMFL